VPENNHQHPFLIAHFSKNFAPPKNDAPNEPTEKLLTPDPSNAHQTKPGRATIIESLAEKTEEKTGGGGS